MITGPVLAWHFIGADHRLTHADGREVKVGKKLTVNTPIQACWHGLHASRKAIDALMYADLLSNRSVICRVELSGQILDAQDKLVASERTVIAMTDAIPIVQEWMGDCLQHALNKHKVPANHYAWKIVQGSFDAAYGGRKTYATARQMASLRDRLARDRAMPYSLENFACPAADAVLRPDFAVNCAYRMFEYTRRIGQLEAMLLEALDLPGPAVRR